MKKQFLIQFKSDSPVIRDNARDVITDFVLCALLRRQAQFYEVTEFGKVNHLNPIVKRKVDSDHEWNEYIFTDDAGNEVIHNTLDRASGICDDNLIGLDAFQVVSYDVTVYQAPKFVLVSYQHVEDAPYRGPDFSYFSSFNAAYLQMMSEVTEVEGMTRDELMLKREPDGVVHLDGGMGFVGNDYAYTEFWRWWIREIPESVKAE